MENEHIRNFCIIAHIDHGKSTLADRLLECTNTIEKREMRDQALDTMDLERERGITIKLQPVRMEYSFKQRPYVLNLIDTPGHVDFTYEVSRSLAACEGAILLVDATQGVQAQTISNLQLALEQNLTIIPALNKIDLFSADQAACERELIHLLGCDPQDIVRVSGKTGEGVQDLIAEIIERVPPPRSSEGTGTAALIFDSRFDEYRGVIASIRMMNGTFKKGDRFVMMSTDASGEILDLGYFKPHLTSVPSLSHGSIGYLVTGLKSVSDCQVGDTIGKVGESTVKLPGYKSLKPMVFAGLFLQEGDRSQDLREGLGKLKLNDAALQFEPEHSKALGFGFRAGFLGLLHCDIVQERLKREFGLHLIITTPSVGYRVKLRNGECVEIRSPLDLPNQNQIETTYEPWMRLDIITPIDPMGRVLSLLNDRRAKPSKDDMEYLDERRVILRYEIPLASLIVDFYDQLKNVSSGFASMNYEFLDDRPCKVSRLDILVGGDMVEALSSIVYDDQAQSIGRRIVERLKNVLPRQMFEVKLQAAVNGTIVASERISALRKDVTAKLYGGDVTRKRKLLEKQKKGKKRMKSIGRVSIPQSAYLAILKR